MRYTIFDIAGEDFGIEIQGVVEILKPQKLCKIPELPDFVSGVISLRGEIIPVIDMRVRFGITETADKHRIVLIRIEGEKVGLIVDNVTDIVEIPEKKISRPPKLFKGFRAEFIEGLCRDGAKPSDNSKVIIILDIERILTSEEKIRLKTSRKKLNRQGGERAKRRSRKGQE